MTPEHAKKIVTRKKNREPIPGRMSPKAIRGAIVQMKNRISGVLMEAGVNYNKQRLHKAGYFRELLAGHEPG